MLQCKNCEFYSESTDGKPRLLCNPYGNIKEPECLAKWQLLKLETLVGAYTATLEMYERLAPLQEKMFRHMEREIDEAEQADSWKYDEDDEDDDSAGGELAL